MDRNNNKNMFGMSLQFLELCGMQFFKIRSASFQKPVSRRKSTKFYVNQLISAV